MPKHSISQEVTEVSYQMIESNLLWELNCSDSKHYRAESRRVQVPSINGEWYFIFLKDLLVFRIHTDNDGKDNALAEPNSKADQYCFELITSCGINSNVGYNDIPADTFLEYQTSHNNNSKYTINAKVTIKKNIIVEIIPNMLISSERPDFTFIVKSKEFKVRTSVLSTYSTVFRSIFDDEYKQLEINDIEPLIFEKLIDYIYFKKIPEDLDSCVMDLFLAANKYNSLWLVHECEKRMAETVSKDNAMAVYKLANRFLSHTLKAVSLKIIKEKLKESLKITDDILDNIDAEKLENLWDVETKLNDILKKDKIGDKSEVE